MVPTSTVAVTLLAAQVSVVFTATSGNSVNLRADCQYETAVRNTLSWDGVTLGPNPTPMSKSIVGRSTVTAKLWDADAPSGSAAVTVTSASPWRTPRTVTSDRDTLTVATLLFEVSAE